MRLPRTVLAQIGWIAAWTGIADRHIIEHSLPQVLALLLEGAHGSADLGGGRADGGVSVGRAML